MYGSFHRLPYPTHKSPMDGDTANRDLDWLYAAQTDRTFVFRIGERGVTHQQKTDLLQQRFWPALCRWVEFRQEVLPGGTLVGGWWRADMHGMLDWYRECFHLTPRWEDAIAAHSDGVWRILLETSPWRSWPEFLHLLREPVFDENGRVTRDEAGRLICRERDPCADGMEDAFMDVWEVVANSRPLNLNGSSSTSRPDICLPGTAHQHQQHQQQSNPSHRQASGVRV